MEQNVELSEGDERLPNRLVMGGAGLLALLTASCCVLPIGLSIIGLGGTWLTMLGPFVAWRSEILVVVALVLGWGWYRLWRRWRCASQRVSTTLILGFATLAFVLAASSPLWEEVVAQTMWSLWKANT
jgi:mercuric ion transport protein